ncbi:hypothetical protein N0V90_011602 [Kalmusia sp. IMI 367209]|nr:hypothetical protein N0V90_011602 [Kalmusia sp. IMI 367209]
MPWKPAPGVKELSTAHEEYFRYVVEEDAITHLLSVEADLSAFVHSEGPFDGILGFSEGALLAASLIIDQVKNPNSPFAFKCGIFFSAIGTVDYLALRKGELRALDPSVAGKVITIPTAHIWDPHDDFDPGMGDEFLGIGGPIRALCEDNTAEEFKHELKHEIPGSSGTVGVSESVRAISRTLERAATT